MESVKKACDSSVSCTMFLKTTDVDGYYICPLGSTMMSTSWSQFTYQNVVYQKRISISYRIKLFQSNKNSDIYSQIVIPKIHLNIFTLEPTSATPSTTEKSGKFERHFEQYFQQKYYNKNNNFQIKKFTFLLTGIWIQGYTCGYSIGDYFTGSYGYTIAEAQQKCRLACDAIDGCHYAHLSIWQDGQSCYLHGIYCGDWQSNFNSANYLYLKGLKDIFLNLVIY